MSIIMVMVAEACFFYATGFLCGFRLKKAEVERKRPKAKLDDDDHDVTADALMIFNNLKIYFETEKPYLNPELLEKEVAMALHTNRNYLGMCIKMFDGGNFCSFVNKYRIKYALEAFSRNMNLRVGELSRISGFNSPTSFNIAFKVLLNKTPGEWCQAYKSNFIGDKLSEAASEIPQLPDILPFPDCHTS